MGTKLRIPSLADERAWNDLRARIGGERLAAAEQSARMRVHRRHRLEQQIAELEARPADDGRRLAIRLLRERLASLS